MTPDHDDGRRRRPGAGLASSIVTTTERSIIVNAILSARVLVPLGVVWAACFTVAAIQGEGESSGGFVGFLEELPWLVFLLLTLVFVLVGLVAAARWVGRRRRPA